MTEITYPYNDEYMIFDEITRRYVLTEKCITDSLGIDIVGRINGRNAINQQVMIKRLLKLVSNHIYNFIHTYNVNTAKQDYYIATVPSLRKIIQTAMEEQFLFVSQVGDLSRSSDPQKRLQYIDEQAKMTLGQIVPELGRSILYTGRI